MPCTQCKEGKYKWGKTGECEYPTKEACESANHKYSKMKPTPLGQKTYEEYEKELKEFNLSKVEKVELGLIDDLVKKSKKSLDTFSGINASARKAGQIIDKAETEAKKLSKVLNQLEGDWDKVFKQAKELGVTIEGKTRGFAVDISATANTVRNAASQLEKASSIVYGIED